MLKPKFTIIFYKEDSGNQPVIRWIKKLHKQEQINIGEDLQTLQYRWPLGMPLVKYVSNNLWELRSRLENRISRITYIHTATIKLKPST